MWRSVKKIEVSIVWMLGFYRRIEYPTDVAQADPHFILVRKDENLLLRDLEAEDVDMQHVFNLYSNVDAYGLPRQDVQELLCIHYPPVSLFSNMQIIVLSCL